MAERPNHAAYVVALTRSWMQRRHAKGITVPADELWTHIKAKWPSAQESQIEEVFQQAHG